MTLCPPPQPRADCHDRQKREVTEREYQGAVPALEELTEAALAVLSKNPKGYVLLVQGMFD